MRPFSAPNHKIQPEKIHEEVWVVTRRKKEEETGRNNNEGDDKYTLK
jgi:hypothetical protein